MYNVYKNYIYFESALSVVFSLIRTNIDYDEISQGQLAITDFVMAVSCDQCHKYMNERIKCILKYNLFSIELTGKKVSENWLAEIVTQTTRVELKWKIQRLIWMNQVYFENKL